MRQQKQADIREMIRGARILVRGHAFLGDALMTTPFLTELEKMGPASVTVCAGNIGAEVYRRHPAVNAVLADSRELKKEYDIDFVLKDTGRAALASRRLGTPLRIGFRGEGARILLTRTMPGQPLHGALRYFPLLGLPLPDSVEYTFQVSPEEEETAFSLLEGADRPLILSPGTTRPEKMWPEEYFAGLTGLVRRKYPDIPIYLVGSENEAHLCARIAEAAGTPSLAGRTNVGVLAAVLARARILVSGDNGTMHLAHAAGCPAVALFGQTDPARSGPPPGARAAVITSPLPCSPCRRKKCGADAPCMQAVIPELVFDSMVQYL